MRFLTIISLAVLLVSCSKHADIPSQYTQENSLPKIMPDYTEVTIPTNIAPTNFAVQDGCDDVAVRFTAGSVSYAYGNGYKVVIDESEWKELVGAAKGKSIKVEVFSHKDGSWKAYKPFNINVAEDEIDPYVSYRLIQPSYVAYERLSIAQRSVADYEETDIYNNMLVSTETEGQCINCHSYKNYRTDNYLFHMRQSFGGTMIVQNGVAKKYDLKTDSTISAGVYPAWHPTENLIAFSTNSTGQSFHTRDMAKIEVQDTKSDLILFDVSRNEVSYIERDSLELEVFPTWAPDGKTLYYCSAHFEYQDTISKEAEMIKRYKEVKYDIYKKSFDPKSHKFGPRQLVYAAAEQDKSATLPRVSPDGRYLLFALGNWGCFHIWHPEADIHALDLKTGREVSLSVANSKRAESYPSWSSNGRWIMMASRRGDGNYSRIYIAYFDKQGKAHKAFALPQRDPDFYINQLKSYNRPEFMVDPVPTTPQELAAVAKGDTEKATFRK